MQITGDSENNIPNYDKSRKYLEKDKWVKDLIADGKMEKACELAEKYKEDDSYSEIYKAIKKLKVYLPIPVICNNPLH